MTLQTVDSSLFFTNLPFSLEWLPTSAYLVGGAVRDALLQRKKTYLDLDFVLAERAVETASQIARHYQAGFVVLDEKRQIARVVFSKGTVDFALQEGESLELDLRRRDFTVNAIAYNLHEQKLIDPLQGVKDLKQGVLRMVSSTNLKEDPLRLLRAYRQAAQLNFTIEPTTRETIRSLAPLIGKVAAERVQAELEYLFSSSRGSSWLIAAGKDGLLEPWFEEIDTAKLQQLTTVDTVARSLKQKWPNLGKNCSNWLALAKLATLVSQNPTVAELELVRLKYSRAQLRAVVATVRYLPQLQGMNCLRSLREQYFFFQEVKDIFPILVVRALATGVEEKLVNLLVKRYLDPRDLVAHPQPLITGKDLIRNLHIKPSPLIGKLLTEIHIARIENKISTAEEAIEFARFLIELSDSFEY
ncbi:CCA tRNA nucleotidyltransferase [Pleurocapsales cyanobacterium LEGE 06147]|nr:CCA tRNA nucleotidyltransferase [Pleurocapsales cyanobacterium LEGE 06147]